MKKQPAKRVDWVTLKLVRECSFLYQNRSVNSPSDAAELVGRFLENADREHFCVACLDTKNQPNQLHTVSIGTLSSAAVHPREVFKVAVLSGAASVILYHSHPSGQPEPSKEDIEVTRRLAEAGRVLGIEVLDHVVIGAGGRYVSLKERGLLEASQA